MSTATTKNFNEKTIEVASLRGEDLLNKVIDLSKEGYTIVQGTARFSSLKQQVCMEKVGKEEVTPVQETVQVAEKEAVNDEPEAITGEIKISLEDAIKPEENVEKVTFDQALVDSFDKDKEKLEEYGKSLGVDLDKRKNYGNMVKELKKFVEKG